MKHVRISEAQSKELLSRQDEMMSTAQRGILVSVMGPDTYDRLERKYGHAAVWEAFSSATRTFGIAGLSRRMRLYRLIRRWRLRLERLRSWLEGGR